MERLIIKNFGPIVDVDIELKPIMVFIGDQATGKSTISKLIALFRGWEFIFNKKEFTEMLQHYNIASYKTEDSYIKFVSDSYAFELINGKSTISEEKEHSYIKLKESVKRDFPSKAEDIHTDALEKELENVKTELISEAKIDKGRELELITKQKELFALIESRKAFKETFLRYVDETFKLENYSEYIPSERIFISIASGLFMNLTNNKVPLPGTLLSFGAEFEKARTKIKDLNIDCLNGKYRFENNEDRIYVSEDRFIPLSESASGFQAIIPMLLVIENKTKDEGYMCRTFIIEEPELNLFPSTQKRLTQMIVSKCASYIHEFEKSNELVITTHSPYILSSLNNLLLAHKVVEEFPENSDIIDKIIRKNCWINPVGFSAYSIQNGRLTNILDPETNLIAEDVLDGASEEISSEFDTLLEIYYKQRNGATPSE